MNSRAWTSFGALFASIAGLSCLGSNNLLSPCERDAQCRGFGTALNNPFRPVETAADLDR